ncbi:MAG: glycosyltransferase family 1 protein [Candidatus Buchananbacteria bacterium]
MNIGVDIRCLIRGRYNGVAEYTYQLLTALFALDQKNQYWLFYNSYSQVSLPPFNQANVHYVGFRYPNRLLMLGLKLFNWPKLDQLIAQRYLLYPEPIKFDLFFLPNLDFVCFSKKVPVVLTAHDLSYELFPYFFSQKILWWHRLINPRRLAQTAQKILAVSENTKNDLVKIYQIPETKVVKVYSGLDQAFKKITDQEALALARTNWRLPEKFILGLGTIEPRKNWESLILAWQRAKIKYNIPHQLVLVGNQGWLQSSVFNLIKQSRLRQEIRYLNSVQPEERVWLYNLADLFVYPSWYEGFGFPPLEAMACGLPTIIASNSALSEVASAGALLVNPDNIIEISEAMQQVLSDENLKNDLAKRGQQVAGNYPWSKTAQEVLAVFNQLKIQS